MLETTVALRGIQQESPVSPLGCMLMVQFLFCPTTIVSCKTFPTIFRSLVAPTILPFEFGDEEFNMGDTISIACSVIKGDLPVNITWWLNNRTVNTYDGIVVNVVNKKLSTLSVDYVTADHMGDYTCRAVNKAGVASFSAYLRVNGT